MKTPVEKMKELSKYLPEKDIPLADKFISSRDFESLSELVTSAIIKIERGLKSKDSKSKYIGIDLEALESLKSEVDNYLTLLGVDNIDNELYDNLQLEKDY